MIRTGFLPNAALDLIYSVGEHVPNTVHVMQEFGTHFVVLGVVALWFASHYDQSRVFHWAMTAAWGLFALIHWFDVRGPIHSVAGPLVNSIPFVLFAAVGMLRLRAAAR